MICWTKLALGAYGDMIAIIIKNPSPTASIYTAIDAFALFTRKGG